MEACELCRRPFAHHLRFVAHSKIRWRGNSFDSYQAEGKVGIALAKTLGLSAAKREEFARFTRLVSVRSFREKAPIPTERFDPGEGEVWEFHVGFTEPLDPETVDRCRKAAYEALRSVPNYDEVFVEKGQSPDA